MSLLWFFGFKSAGRSWNFVTPVSAEQHRSKQQRLMLVVAMASGGFAQCLLSAAACSRGLGQREVPSDTGMLVLCSTAVAAGTYLKVRQQPVELSSSAQQLYVCNAASAADCPTSQATWPRP